MAKSKMGDKEACLDKKQQRKIKVGRCDIDNRDGTVDHIKQDIDNLRVSERGWVRKRRRTGSVQQ